MPGQGDASNNSLLNPEEQRQYESFADWLDQGGPSSLISQVVQAAIGSENQRRAFVELMNQVDAELTARGIGFQRTNPVNGQGGNGPLMVQQGNISNALTSNIDLNANDPMQAGLTLNPTKQGGPEAPAAHPANPILITSEAYVLEEDGEGGRRQGASSSNGRRPSFKRRAPEDAPGQLLLGESSGSVQQQEDVAAHGNARTGALNGQANLVNRFGQLEAGATSSSVHEAQNLTGRITALESGIGVGPAVINHHHTTAASIMMDQATIRARQAEIFQRNIRPRRNPNLQDFTPASQLTQNPTNSHVQSPSQTATFFPYDHFANSRAQPFHPTPTRQYVQVPEPLQTQQFQFQVPGQGMTISGARGEPAHTHLHEAGFVPGNLSPMTANMNLANGNINFPGNAASSQDPSNSNARISGVPIWYPDQAISYSNRMLQVISSAGNRGLQVDYRPTHSASADMENSVRGGNIMPAMEPRRSRLMIGAERRDADYPDISRRGQHMVQTSLALLHRGGGLRFEDFSVINHSVLLGMPEEEEDDIDEHEDMRLDIDDMSYEELIALGDEIGNVSTGLREEAIFANLRVQKYESFGVVYPAGKGPSCCICLEKYADGEHVGKLDCGHDFHANCVKLWLMRKNRCPICKETGLAGKQGEH